MANDLSDFYRGTTRTFTITVTDILTGLPVDISADGMTLYIKSRKSDPNSSALLTKAGDVITSGTTGIAMFTLTPTDTDIPPGMYYYEFLLIRNDASEYIILTGQVAIQERVSDV